MSPKKPLRVLIQFPSPYLYGTERTILELFDTLRPQVKPHFLLSHSALRRRLPILEIVRKKRFVHSFLRDTNDWPVLGKPRSLPHLWAMLSAAFRFNWACLKNARRKDVIYLAGVHGLYYALLAAIIFRLQKKRVVLHFHELMIPWGPLNIALKLVAPLATDYVHFTQYSLEETLKVNTFLAGEKNVVLPPVVAVRTSAESDAEVQQFAGKCNLVFIGQIAPHKGIDLLIDAFETISSQYKDATLHVLGTCSEAYRKEFHERIQVLEEQGRLRFWGFRNDAHSFIKIATVFVQPTRPSIYHESFGRGVVEAMAMGVPSICFRSGALQELMVHESTGLVCEEESAQCLEESLRRLLDDPELRRHCSEGSAERYRLNYSTEKTKELWLQFFKEHP